MQPLTGAIVFMAQTGQNEEALSGVIEVDEFSLAH